MEDSLDALEKWIKNEFKRSAISKDSKTKLQGIFVNLKKASSELLSNLYYLEEKSDCKAEIIAHIEQTVRESARSAVPLVPQPTVPSFAGVVRAGARDPPPRNVVFVKKEGLSPQELRRKLKECVVPKRNGVNVV